MVRNNKGQFVKGTNGNTFEGFGIWYDQKGYPSIWVGAKGIRLHIYIWEREYGPKPKGHDIHHKDFDKGNYSLKNLILLKHSDHMKVHAGWIKTNGEWSHKPCTKCGKVLPLDQFYVRRGYTPSSMCKKCHCETTKVWADSHPEKRRQINRESARKARKAA